MKTALTAPSTKIKALAARPARAFRRTSGGLLLRPRRTIFVLTVVAALCAGVVGVLAWQSHDQRGTSLARSQAVDTAQSGVVAALSYDHRSLARDIATAKRHLTGALLDDYSRLMSTVVEKAAKKEKTITRASLSASSVMSATTDRVELLLFLNQTTARKGAAGPQLDSSRVRSTLIRVGDTWLISELKPI